MTRAEATPLPAVTSLMLNTWQLGAKLFSSTSVSHVCSHACARGQVSSSNVNLNRKIAIATGTFKQLQHYKFQP